MKKQNSKKRSKVQTQLPPPSDNQLILWGMRGAKLNLDKSTFVKSSEEKDLIKERKAIIKDRFLTNPTLHKKGIEETTNLILKSRIPKWDSFQILNLVY